MTLISFVLTVIATMLVTALFFNEDYLPKYLQVWVEEDGKTAPKDKDDSFSGKPYLDEHGNLVINVRISDRKTFLDKAKREFLRRLEIMEKRKTSSRSLSERP